MTDTPIPKLEVLACCSLYTHEHPPSDVRDPRQSICERCQVAIWIPRGTEAWLQEKQGAGHVLCSQCVFTIANAEACQSFELVPGILGQKAN